MRTARIAKDFTFEAAHQLYNHDGKCAQPHGHSYRARVEVQGLVRPEDGTSGEGMVLDFDRLKALWREFLEPLLDHQDLNRTLGGIVGPTTAENIAGWIVDRFAALITFGHDGLWVTVWETPTSSATVWK